MEGNECKVVGMAAHKLRLICSVCDATFFWGGNEKSYSQERQSLRARMASLRTTPGKAHQSATHRVLLPRSVTFVPWFVSVYGFVSVSDAISFSAQHRKDAD